MTKKQAAKFLGYQSEKTIDRLVRAKRLPSYRARPGAHPRFKSADLRAMMVCAHPQAPHEDLRKFIEKNTD